MKQTNKPKQNKPDTQQNANTLNFRINKGIAGHFLEFYYEPQPELIVFRPKIIGCSAIKPEYTKDIKTFKHIVRHALKGKFNLKEYLKTQE